MCVLYTCTQGQDYFSKRYELSGANLNGFVSVLTLTDGILAIGSDFNASAPGTQFLITKTDFSGDTIWTRRYGDTLEYWYPGFPGCLIETLDKNFIFTGSYATGGNDNVLLVKFDQNGDTLWTKNHGGADFDVGYNVIELVDSSLVISGTTINWLGPNQNILLLKTDKYGDVLWTTDHGGSAVEGGFNIQCTQDNGFIVSGLTSSFGPAQNNPYAVKFNATGAFQWDYTFGGTNDDDIAVVTETVDGDFAVGYCLTEIDLGLGDEWRRAHVAKLNSSGGLLWDYEYGPIRYGTHLRRIIETPDSGYVAVGGLGDTSVWEVPTGLGMKVNYDGDSLWYKEYKHLFGEFSQNYLRDVAVLGDSQLVAVGFMAPAVPDTGNQDSWILLLDSIGCDSVNCIGVGVPETHTDRELKLYPNPTNGTVYLECDLPIANANVLVYDLMGKLMASETLTSETGMQVLDLNSLTHGLYHYVITSDSELLKTGKLVINR